MSELPRPSPLSDLLAPEQRELGDLYAILDGARDKAVHEFTREVDSPWMYLEDGIVEANYQTVAPRVVALEFWPPTTIERFLAAAWGQSWGVFLRTQAEFNELRRHLRGLSSVTLPNGNLAQFRFYDPRVLRGFVPTCAADELATLFGPISEFVMEAEDPTKALRHVFEDRRLSVEELALES